MNQYTLSHKYVTGYLDSLHIDRSGLIRIEGWDRNKMQPDFSAPRCTMNGKEVHLLQTFRTYRPDVASALHATFSFNGIAYVYRLTEPFAEQEVTIEVTFQDEVVFHQQLLLQVLPLPYEQLIDTTDVQHREDIYGEGDPVDILSYEVQSLAHILNGPVLDFGCGLGYLVKYLRDAGVEAYGIELDRGAIRDHVVPEVKEYITLYDGSTPLPFKDNQFKSTIAIEVMEHIPDYKEMIQELARVTSDQYVMSVPDISSVPVLYQHMVVPWHLLEGTHVNFFTQHSLTNLLKQHFKEVMMGKIQPVITNNTQWYTSLLAFCRK